MSQALTIHQRLKSASPHQVIQALGLCLENRLHLEQASSVLNNLLEEATLPAVVLKKALEVISKQNHYSLESVRAVIKLLSGTKIELAQAALGYLAQVPRETLSQAATPEFAQVLEQYAENDAEHLRKLAFLLLRKLGEDELSKQVAWSFLLSPSPELSADGLQFFSTNRPSFSEVSKHANSVLNNRGEAIGIIRLLQLYGERSFRYLQSFAELLTQNSGKRLSKAEATALISWAERVGKFPSALEQVLLDVLNGKDEELFCASCRMLRRVETALPLNKLRLLTVNKAPKFWAHGLIALTAIGCKDGDYATKAVEVLLLELCTEISPNSSPQCSGMILSEEEKAILVVSYEVAAAKAICIIHKRNGEEVREWITAQILARLGRQHAHACLLVQSMSQDLARASLKRVLSYLAHTIPSEDIVWGNAQPEREIQRAILVIAKACPMPGEFVEESIEQLLRVAKLYPDRGEAAKVLALIVRDQPSQMAKLIQISADWFVADSSERIPATRILLEIKLSKVQLEAALEAKVTELQREAGLMVFDAVESRRGGEECSLLGKFATA